MKTTTLPLLALAAGLPLLAAPAVAQDTRHPHATSHERVPQQRASNERATAPRLQAALRDLWQAHVVHTRDYAFAAKAGRADDAQRAEQAVVANAKQIADAVVGFYGADAGKRMLQLLGGHWDAVKTLTDAKRAGDTRAGAVAMQDLTANAREIAAFLAGANPHLTQEALLGLLMAHGGHHAAQINQVMAGDMKGEQATWIAMQAHMRTIADALAAALARQFPDKAA